MGRSALQNRDDLAKLEKELLTDDDVMPPNTARKTTPPKARKTKPPKARLLGRLSVYFVRVPVEWLKQAPAYGVVFPPRTALFLYVWFRSHEGRRGVKVTDAETAELGISARRKRQVISELEAAGLVRVERQKGRTMTVWPITGGGSSAAA
jgi:hypothetical protein